LITYSEQFDNAAWTKASATVSANSAISPDGTQNADLIYPTSSASNLGAYQFNAGVISVVGTVSCYVKSAGKNWALLGTDNTSPYNVSFDLVNGVVGSVPSGYTATITSVGNGWYRITATFQIGSSLGYPFIGVADNTNRSVTADGTNGIYIWGFQAELSSYATSIIPTTSASATRVADACSKTGISSLIGGTSGTVFFDIKTNPVLTTDNYKQFFYYTDSSANQGYMYLNSGNGIITNPPFGNLSSSITLSPNTRYKIALTYASNDCALYVNGVSVATASSATPLNFANLLSLGSYQASSEFNQFVFNQYTHFPSRLTNAELVSLTTI
jgi:hypothetical protein